MPTTSPAIGLNPAKIRTIKILFPKRSTDTNNLGPDSPERPCTQRYEDPSPAAACKKRLCQFTAARGSEGQTPLGFPGRDRRRTTHASARAGLRGTLHGPARRHSPDPLQQPPRLVSSVPRRAAVRALHGLASAA